MQIKPFKERTSVCLYCHKPWKWDRKINPEYMVKNEVWAEAGWRTFDGVCHFTCLEKKLNRQLNLNDLTNTPINKNEHIIKLINARYP